MQTLLLAIVPLCGRNRSPEAINYPQLVTVTVQMCPRFVRFALLRYREYTSEGETNKDGVQVNGYMRASVTVQRWGALPLDSCELLPGRHPLVIASIL